MKRAIKKKSNVYTYLNNVKVLEAGSEQDITDARNEYWRGYKAEWRKQKRKSDKEFTLLLSKDEVKTLTEYARKHKQSRTKFLKNAAFSYMHKVYVAPDLIEVRRIGQFLAMAYNDMHKAVIDGSIQAKYGRMLIEKIQELERNVLVALHNPKSLEEWLMEVTRDNPKYKCVLLEILKNV